jgi:hypothetical protein
MVDGRHGARITWQWADARKVVTVVELRYGGRSTHRAYRKGRLRALPVSGYGGSNNDP